MSTRTPSSSSSRLMLTIGLCFLVALMEGLDLQAAGIAAGGIAQAFALDKMQMGWIFSAGILGLGNDSNLLIVFYVQIMPDDFVMQLHRF